MVETTASSIAPERVASAEAGPLKLPPPGMADVWVLRLKLGQVANGGTPADRRPAARQATRAILARYLDLSPATLQFICGPFGKPELRGSPLSFSVSHRDDRALLAVAAQGRLGVDLEARRPLPELDGICAMLHPAERTLIAQASASEHEDLFYRIWTRKEAALKAVGTGLALGLDGISVLADQTFVPSVDRSRANDAAPLSLHDIALDQGWFAALASETGCRTLRLFAPPETAAPQETRR